MQVGVLFPHSVTYFFATNVPGAEIAKTIPNKIHTHTLTHQSTTPIKQKHTHTYTPTHSTELSFFQ